MKHNIEDMLVECEMQEKRCGPKDFEKYVNLQVKTIDLLRK